MDISHEALKTLADCVSANVKAAADNAEGIHAYKDMQIASLKERVAELELRERLMRERVEWLLGGPGPVPSDWHSFEQPVRPDWLYDS